jgi:hypothetical protein
VCGDAVLTGNVTLGPGAVLEVVDGWVDLGSFTLSGDAAGNTIVFTGNANPGFTPNAPYVTGGNGSTWNMTDPTSGTWAGFAIYTDPSTTDVPAASFKIAGSGGPNYIFNGLWYSPNANLTLSGCLGGVTSTACSTGTPTQCLGFLTNTFTIDGNGGLVDTTGCKVATLNSSNENFLAGVVELVR